MEPKTVAIEDLAHSFPCLRRAVGIRPWDANLLADWAGGPVSHGERVTAQFVLAVWCPDEAWPCGRFDLMEALAVWDLPHRAAFLAWATDPWWP